MQDPSVSYNDAQRTGVIEYARTLPLLDRVFAVIFFNEVSRVFGPKPKSAPIDFEQHFSDVELALLDDAGRKTAELFKRSYRIGNGLLREGMLHAEALATLKQECPGFSDKTYGILISHGCWEAK